MQGFSAQGLSDIFWASSTAEHRAVALFDAVAVEAMHKLQDFQALRALQYSVGLCNGWAQSCGSHMRKLQRFH
eukprot:scaffold454763_cov24-Prasinocladus_malaysianus.AAC.1